MEFLRIQIPTDRTSGTRTRSTQILTYKFVEICSTLLTTAPRWPITVNDRIDAPGVYLKNSILSPAFIRDIANTHKRKFIISQLFRVPLFAWLQISSQLNVQSRYHNVPIESTTVRRDSITDQMDLLQFVEIP